MPKVTFALLIVFLIAQPSCESNRTAETDCQEPQNPYTEDPGHYKGFEWAQENGAGCDTASQSFNEGCEEYHRQMVAFAECQNQKAKSQ
jgi:hypothetical protein